MSTVPTTQTGRPRNIWIALAVLVVYVLLAAVGGNLLPNLVGDDQPATQFALGHFIPLGIGIAFLLLFLRWAAWGSDVWRERPTPTLTPRRWWLVSIPVLAVVVPITQMSDIPWLERSAGFVAIIALGTLMVGFGEELVIRGILLTAVRTHHGELVVLLVTAGVFALAHIPGSLIRGVPAVGIAFQVAVLFANGVTFYWIRRVTGRLWVAMLVHAFTDWVLYLGSGAATPTASIPHDHAPSFESSIGAAAGILLWLAAAASVVSVIREDRRAKQVAAAPATTAADSPH